jgi:hypothetical protein
LPQLLQALLEMHEDVGALKRLSFSDVPQGSNALARF